MFARWLSNNQPNTVSDATLSGFRFVDAGFVAHACASVANTITGSGMSRTRLSSDTDSFGTSAIILGGFERDLRGERGLTSVLGNSPLNSAPDYPKQRQHQSHFRERCLTS